MIQLKNINNNIFRQYLLKLGLKFHLTERIRNNQQRILSSKKWKVLLNSAWPFFKKNKFFTTNSRNGQLGNIYKIITTPKKSTITMTTPTTTPITTTTTATKTVTEGKTSAATPITIPEDNSHNAQHKISLPKKTIDLPRLLKLYKELAKAKLATLVILTTMCGYAMAPMSTDLLCLLATTTGTGLCVASANAFNQWIEIPYDAQMSRTRNRVLVRNALSPFHAFTFGTITGIVGVGILSTMVNQLTAILGASNIFLYTCIYTQMKRMTIANTWVGSMVGAIPPIMGWAACTNNLEIGSLILGSILFAWQFPHFNALAWNMRFDYEKAGYKMMVVKNPSLNSRVSLRYALALFPLSIMIPFTEMTTWWFALDSSLINSVLLLGAYRFWKDSNDKSARDLFFASLIHLPVIMALMMAHKKDWRNELNELNENDEELMKKVLLELEIENFVDKEIEKEFNVSNIERKQRNNIIM